MLIKNVVTSVIVHQILFGQKAEISPFRPPLILNVEPLPREMCTHCLKQPACLYTFSVLLYQSVVIIVRKKVGRPNATSKPHHDVRVLQFHWLNGFTVYVNPNPLNSVRLNYYVRTAIVGVEDNKTRYIFDYKKPFFTLHDKTKYFQNKMTSIKTRK